VTPTKLQERLADAALIMVTIFWGVSFVVIKDALAMTTPANLTFWRFFITCAMLLPVGFIKRHDFSPGLIKPGALCGVLLFLAFFTQASGLVFTLASRAGFLTGLNVVFTPLLVVLLFKRLPSPLALTGALLAFAGLYMLSLAGEAHGVPLNIGDLLNLGCALFVSCHVLALARYAPGSDSFWLTYLQFLIIALACFLWALLSGGLSFDLPAEVWLAALFLAGLCTVAAFWTQTWAQKFIPPTRTAIIFSLEPVTAAICGYVFLKEPLGVYGAIGGGMIVLGLIIAEFKPQKWESVA
jgi:drug/metabolite transporter (DMT)-like permease